MSRPKTEFQLDRNMLDLYSDYLLVNLGGLATASGMANLVNLSNDSVSRFLGGIKFQSDGKKFDTHIFDSKDLWKLVKPTIRKDEFQDACIVIDDTVQEKDSSDESDLICYHFDHCSGRNIKGINLVNFLYLGKELVTPISFELVTKPEKFLCPKTNTTKRKSTITKNEIAQRNLNQIIKNQVQFKYVLMDIWFACNDTLELINKHKKSYVAPLKSNRKIATSYEDKLSGKWIKLDNPELNQKLDNEQKPESIAPIAPIAPIEVWLEGLDHSVLLVKKVFTNKDNSTGTMFLITNDKNNQEVNQDKNQLYTIYQKRWKVEEFHKSLKSNLAFAKSPTKTITTQSNHFFCSIYSYFKLELLTKFTKLKNHFNLKYRLYHKAQQSALQELERLKLLVSCER